MTKYFKNSLFVNLGIWLFEVRWNADDTDQAEIRGYLKFRMNAIM